MQAVCESLPTRGSTLPPSLEPRRIRLATEHRLRLVMPDKTQESGAQVEWARQIEAVALRRDRAAFAKLFNHFAPRVKAYMCRSGASDSEAENLAQETMLKLWRKAELFNPASAGGEAWIFTIARNLRIDAQRREKRGALGDATDIDDEFLLDDGPLPDAALATQQGEARIRIALSELSREQQKVVELSFYQEKAHAEIALALDIPLGTVKSRLRLAMAKLRNLLDDLS